jgi:hypothetical protein
MPFGQTINAGLMRPDYSNIVRAGQATGEGYEAIGKAAGGILESLGEMKKQQKQEDADIAVGVQIAKLLEQKSPGLIPGAGELAINMSDTNIPRAERLGMAKYILNALSIGTKVQEEQRQQQELGLRGRALDIQERESNFRMQPQSDALDSYLSFPKGGGSAADGSVLPQKGSLVPSNPYVDGLDPNSIQY